MSPENMMRKILPALLLAFAISLTGCKDSGTPAPQTPAGTTATTGSSSKEGSLTKTNSAPSTTTNPGNFSGLDGELVSGGEPPSTSGDSPTSVTTSEGTGPGKTQPGSGAPLVVQATGYFPPPPGGYKSKREAAMEGGALDCRGKKLRTLQDYNPNDPSDYVSCATDPRVIRTGTYFTLDEFPGVRFLACDVGSAIKGKHIDICCKTEAQTFKLPSSVTVRTID